MRQKLNENKMENEEKNSLEEIINYIKAWLKLYKENQKAVGSLQIILKYFI